MLGLSQEVREVSGLVQEGQGDPVVEGAAAHDAVGADVLELDVEPREAGGEHRVGLMAERIANLRDPRHLLVLALKPHPGELHVHLRRDEVADLRALAAPQDEPHHREGPVHRTADQGVVLQVPWVPGSAREEDGRVLVLSAARWPLLVASHHEAAAKNKGAGHSNKPLTNPTKPH